MPRIDDGPASSLFFPIPFKGNATLKSLPEHGCSDLMARNLGHAPSGDCVCWGVPFVVKRPIVLTDRTVRATMVPFKARWMVFLHTADIADPGWNDDGLITTSRGWGCLGEHVAEYTLDYDDGTVATAAVRRRREIGMVTRPWGECCFEAVMCRKPFPIPDLTNQVMRGSRDLLVPWGTSQTRAANPDIAPWCTWLWAWENPHPRKTIVALRFTPVSGVTVISAVSAGNVAEHPLRWGTRRKALLRLPKGVAFDPKPDARGALNQVQLDLGQVISAQPRLAYPDADWASTPANLPPEPVAGEVLVEYTAHPDAAFHVLGKAVPVARLDKGSAGRLEPVAPSNRRVTLRIVEKGSGKPVAAKLHVHGAAGEYLAPVDRHRIPNPHWFEDYSCDFTHNNLHHGTYVPGETVIDLPEGPVYVEVTKGFEIRPVRKMLTVTGRTRELTVTLEKVLPWRERGWVTADTHVHFLSPQTARLEGEAEGVNVVNLLASQWGELMTNVGDFDGSTTIGSRENGGDGEWLVRVGTENRQHVLGHISLLGYSGRIIAPMCQGGPDEAAVGDPVGILLTEWARQCKAQGGLVVVPHFPNPRAEHTAALLEGAADAVEMTSWGNLYGGIDPYSLSDWYRYLNCGYMRPAVGGTDKMSATTAVGTVRTYARIPDGTPFSYDAWMQAVCSGDTFVTYGPLMEFAVEGRPAGSSIALGRTGGTLDVSWELASVTLPMTRLDLIVNGAIAESCAVKPHEDCGHFTVKAERSSWIALLVRGHIPGKPEIIAAHTSPVAAEVEGSPFHAEADALTLLEQIEGALAYLDTLATRAETAARKRMRMTLTAAHRDLHNRMHRAGQYHRHTAVEHHEEHK